ncbi:hypothetical protein PDJAM_G00196040, partial [Pangasius djambal]|nr:hypothetical protein [Pangasius djambal]
TTHSSSSCCSDRFINPVPRAYPHSRYITHQYGHHLHQQPCSPVLSCWFCWVFPAFSPSQWHRLQMGQTYAVLSFTRDHCLHPTLSLMKKQDPNVQFLES